MMVFYHIFGEDCECRKYGVYVEYLISHINSSYWLVPGTYVEEQTEMIEFAMVAIFFSLFCIRLDNCGL